MRILLTGGGTLGSVSPLLALVPGLRAQQHEVRWVGTASGPERALVEQAGVTFTAIAAAKFPRYFTWRLVLISFQLAVAKWQALVYLLRWRPDRIVSAGSFVSVPVVWMGWFLRIPVIIHQQDLQPGLANRLMQPFARVITVAFEDSIKQFPAQKVKWIGNPVRDLTPTTSSIQLDPAYPTVLIFGGGTGASAINALVTEQICEYANVIHVTGEGKENTTQTINHQRYHAYPFLADEMKEALAKADVVVARAGLGTISELGALGKPAIIIPMPATHQEQNAQLLSTHQAAIVLDQRALNADTFSTAVRNLLDDKKTQQQLSRAISGLHKTNSSAEFIRLIDQMR